ncbi:DUF7927 domain-containing protein [Vibrio alginolyticus]
MAGAHAASRDDENPVGTRVSPSSRRPIPVRRRPGRGKRRHLPARGTNTGETGLDDVVITDDLSPSAAACRPPTRCEPPSSATARSRLPRWSGNELRWSGSLAQGESITITYSVIVHADAAGAKLHNVAVGTATPSGGETITPPTSSTDNPVLTPLALTGGSWPRGCWLWRSLCLGGAVLLIVRRRRSQA